MLRRDPLEMMMRHMNHRNRPLRRQNAVSFSSPHPSDSDSSDNDDDRRRLTSGDSNLFQLPKDDDNHSEGILPTVRRPN